MIDKRRQKKENRRQNTEDIKIVTSNLQPVSSNLQHSTCNFIFTITYEFKIIEINPYLRFNNTNIICAEL